MGKLMGFRLIRKMMPYDFFGLIKTKAKPILTASDLSKKASDKGDTLFVDITGPFPLTATLHYKARRKK